MINLMWFTEEHVLDAMLLEPVDDWQLAFPNLEEDTMLLGKPQEAQAVATWPAICKVWAPKPKNAAKLMQAAMEPQDM